MSTNVFTGETYEEYLSRDWEVAMREGSDFFGGQAKVHEALLKITRRIEELGVSYAVVGGMALVRHGYRRFTEDVDILVERSSLAIIHEQLAGRGYLPPFTGSKNLRDCELGVKIEFLITGDYPGDGKPKPVAFPNPAEVCEKLGPIQFLRLSALVELKLASGVSSPHRLKDLADVQELIQIQSLPLQLGEQLNPYVREKYVELWTACQGSRDENQ